MWSPDGSRIAFESAMAKPFFYYTNTAIAVVPAAGGAIENISSTFDENPSLIKWTADGVFFSAASHTWSYLYSINPSTHAIDQVRAGRQLDRLGLQPDARWTHGGVRGERRDHVSRDLCVRRSRRCSRRS